MITGPTRQEIRTIFSITFLARSVSIIVQTVAPIVLVSVLDAPSTMIGWLIAGFWIANALGGVIAISVIRNRRLSILTGFVLLALSFIGLAALHNEIEFGFMVVISGLGLSLVQVFLVPSMYLSGEKDRPHSGIATYSTALALGMIIGPVSASVAIWFYGFSILFAILAGVAVGSLVLTFRIGFQKFFDRENLARAITLSKILAVLKKRGFSYYYLLNLLYSMLLPIFLSYGGVFAGERWGLTAPEVLGLFAAVFAVSITLRTILAYSQIAHFQVLLVTSFSVLFISFFLIGDGTNFPLFLAGFLLFSVPHALIYPSAAFKALEAGGNESIVSSSYLFTTSSGIAEFVAPLIAVPIIVLYRFSGVFLLMSPIAVFAVILAILLPRVMKFASESVSQEA